jgi:hypothetical protein
MRSITRHLTPDELRILWILTAVVLMGIGGRVWISSHQAADPGVMSPGGPAAAKAP